MDPNTIILIWFFSIFYNLILNFDFYLYLLEQCFRCVDEINQGLDERNERRVWDMILAAATTDQGSQYFYLAPKMPYNLTYRPGTVVHLCHASDVIKRPISSVDESETCRWLSAAKKLKCDS